MDSNYERLEQYTRTNRTKTVNRIQTNRSLKNPESNHKLYQIYTKRINQNNEEKKNRQTCIQLTKEIIKHDK